ncbi:hypothetical protein INT45_000740, partial [Circinella minor]
DLKILPDINLTREWLETQGFIQSGLVGFCWGVHIAVKLIDEDSFFGGASLIHPSTINVKDAENAAAPILALPSKNEPDMTEYMKILAKKPFGAQCKYRRFEGQSLYENVASSRVLMVGAGGIGCELLKNLVLSGFKNIEVIDLDTIDISNLNRQFLFQKQHVKKSKAHVAKESALKFNPNVNITSYQANIKDPEFSVTWFSQFTIVFNALDNLEARRHVNEMCLAADVPLVESGTTGYLGQAYVIKKNVTECFVCEPKPTPTTFPVCTIRSTPSAPIHCIVWAKSYLFK